MNNPTLKHIPLTQNDAFANFGIKKEEWIEYVDTVIEMYNIMDQPDIRNFGVITAIMPMHNNKHLL